MNAPLTARLNASVQGIENMPSTPAVLLPLLKLLNAPPETVRLDDIVQLVSYDNAIALQCLRVASSPLFGLAQAPKSIKAAVIGLGLRRVQTILLTCCLGQAFPAKNWPLNPTVFWKHSLGCAMVCRKLSEKLAGADHDKAYMAALLHDIGILVNCIAFPGDFGRAVEQACGEQLPLADCELAVMGFTHCESGQALAQKWRLADDITQVIAHHHAIEHCESSQSLVALVHLGDLLCRMRNLGYGYYERQKVDMTDDPAWAVLLKEHSGLEGVDLARFTFELDEDLVKIEELVSTIYGTSKRA
jgi:putative nucleotidyltransferase with HDIG domain